uniref:Tetratricopeptide repeat protein 29 n=1 Tax=Calidris pygmaea TaxID=425635 RepID=A0A8C3JUY4_9CHAR
MGVFSPSVSLFYQYQLKNTSVFLTCFQYIYWYLFIIAIFTSLGCDISNHILAECFMSGGKNTFSPLLNCRGLFLKAVLVICTYLASNRNSYKKNICIDMLRQGYHKSFSELFTLIQKWNALREAAGPGSAIWQRESLEEQPDKLDQLYHFLTGAEAAQRAGHYEEMYDNQLNLAYCFNDPEDKWLSNYFYEQCFNTAQLVKIDGGKREAQAHANMGLICEEQGHVMKAAEHFEAFYQLTEGLTWKDETGHTYNSLACEHLWRIYTLLADKMLENKEHQQAIKTLIKALKMAKEGGDMKMEGEAAYCLSLAYNFAGEQQTALSVSLFLQFSSFLCFLYKGKYNEAFEYFSRASEAAKTLNNLPLVEETKTYYGIAKAHKLMVAFNSRIEAEDPVSLKYLLAWKENRSDMCTDPLTVGKTLVWLAQNCQNVEEQRSYKVHLY